jgi:hypothetical protein
LHAIHFACGATPIPFVPTMVPGIHKLKYISGGNSEILIPKLYFYEFAVKINGISKGKYFSLMIFF